MWKCICDYFKRKPKYEEPEKGTLRTLFNVECEYLVEYNYELKTKTNADGTTTEEAIGYIVCLDPENDIDWKDTRDKSAWSPDDLKAWSRCISRLDDAHAEPTGHLDKETVKTFKKKLAAGYVLCFEKNFAEVDAVIENALDFLRKRNQEESRKIFLIASTFIATVVFASWLVNQCCGKYLSEKWSLALLMGVLGAYFSIWTRYGKLTFKGLSSKSLHWLEALTRLIIGAISASVMVLALDSKFIMAEMPVSMTPYIFGIIGFAGGFSERSIHTLMDKIVETNDKDNE